MNTERRFIGTQRGDFGTRATAQRAKPRVERRGDGKSPMATGYAAVFYNPADPGTEYWLYSDMVERIMPTAFDAAIAAPDDVRGLTNHDSSWLLGRTANGTCRLAKDDFGLRYEIDLPDTQAGRDTAAMLDRGDMDGSSFAFLVYSGVRGKVVWTEENRDGKLVTVREVHDLELFDVGPVTWPAYRSTTSGMRSAFAEQLQREPGYLRLRSRDADVEIDIAQRMRLLEIDRR